MHHSGLTEILMKDSPCKILSLIFIGIVVNILMYNHNGMQMHKHSLFLSVFSLCILTSA